MKVEGQVHTGTLFTRLHTPPFSHPSLICDSESQSKNTGNDDVMFTINTNWNGWTGGWGLNKTGWQRIVQSAWMCMFAGVHRSLYLNKLLGQLQGAVHVVGMCGKFLGVCGKFLGVCKRKLKGHHFVSTMDKQL